MDSVKILDRALELKEEIIANRRYLHAHPELGFELENTRAFVKKKLSEMGYQPLDCGGGVVAIAGSKQGRTFLIRADMDALPIKEESGVDFAADNGRMHACGHDTHTAMLLGAAKLLKENERELQGQVKLMFQPAEEISSGARRMLEAGVMENPHVDAAMMIHSVPGMKFAPGTMVVSEPGASNPAADFFERHVFGRGCHGSMPASGIDPITAAAHIIVALEHIHARELSAGERAALTIGTVHGGNASNAIPDEVVMSGTLRTFDENVRTNIKRRMEEITEFTAKALGARAEVRFISGTPVLVNDSEMSRCTLEYLQEMLGTDMAVSSAQADEVNNAAGADKPMASEDFANISRLVPTIMMNVTTGRPEEGYTFPLHHCKVTFDERALSYGSAAYAYTAMRWLELHK